MWKIYPICFLMEETNKEVQNKLMEKIKKGIYHTENLIVPQKYEKVILKNGRLLNEEIQVSGRKIPLRNIVQPCFKNKKIILG